MKNLSQQYYLSIDLYGGGVERNYFSTIHYMVFKRQSRDLNRRGCFEIDRLVPGLWFTEPSESEVGLIPNKFDFVARTRITMYNNVMYLFKFNVGCPFRRCLLN